MPALMPVSLFPEWSSREKKGPIMRLLRAVPVFAMCLSVSLPGAVRGQSVAVTAADISGRVVVGQAYADPARQRKDRRIVSPFPADKRVIMRPVGLEQAGTPATPAVSASIATVPAAPTVPVAPATYVETGPLFPVAPAVSSVPAPAPLPDAGYVDIGPYEGGALPVTSFSPD